MFLLLHGPDEYSAREELARLRETGGFDFNQDTFTGDDADIAQIRMICDTLPFLSEQRLVVLLGLPKAKRGAASDEDDAAEPASAPEKPAGKGKKGKSSGPSPRAFIQALADYAPHVPATTTLVVVAGKLEASATPLLKAAEQHGQSRIFNTPRGPQLDQWVARRAQASGASITPDAVKLLIELVGLDSLRALVSEIEKLCIYVGRDGQIGVQQVRALTSSLSESSIFDLTDALARRDHGRAIVLLHELLASGVAALAIVGLTAAQTRALIQVKALSERGMRSPQIAQTAGLAPFVVDKSLPLARKFTFAQLEAAHRSLLDVDIALKSSRMTPELALDLLTLQFGVTSG
ncbi:MAG TPA: DNA polymerase III subunit delta [Ktedonobacterales bacterium]|jgi:DNA polymerase-3 subunit delta|nr:DNA polymerase III subunit delta [Ktedonobacterales bacterium]